MPILARISLKIPRTNPITATAMISGTAAMISASRGVKIVATSVRIGEILSLSDPADTMPTMPIRNTDALEIASFARIPKRDSFFSLVSVFDINNTMTTAYIKLYKN